LLRNDVTTFENTLQSALVAEVNGISDPLTSLILNSLKQLSAAVQQQQLQMSALADKVRALTLSAASLATAAASTVMLM